MSEMMAWVQYSSAVGFDFKGRARRREYWWNVLYWGLISAGISIGAQIISFILTAMLGVGDGTVLMVLVPLISFASWVATTVICIWKLLPIAVRRLHDRGLSGWIYLVCMLTSCCCGIGSIVMIVLTCLDSQPGTNQYGLNPKEPEQSVVYGDVSDATYVGPDHME